MLAIRGANTPGDAVTEADACLAGGARAQGLGQLGYACTG